MFRSKSQKVKTSIHVKLKVLVTIFEHFLVKNHIFFQITQGCGNTMPDLSSMVPFHSRQVENFYLLVLGQVQMYRDQARGRLGRNGRPGGGNFALNGTQGEVGVSLKKRIFFFFFFFF